MDSFVTTKMILVLFTRQKSSSSTIFQPGHAAHFVSPSCMLHFSEHLMPFPAPTGSHIFIFVLYFFCAFSFSLFLDCCLFNVHKLFLAETVLKTTLILDTIRLEIVAQDNLNVYSLSNVTMVHK